MDSKNLVRAPSLRESSTMDWEFLCLCCDPFAGDDSGGGDGDRILSDKMVTARKAGTCHICEGPIVPKTRVRRRTEVYDGELMRFGWCEPCCRAMADQNDDDLAARYEQGRAIRDAGHS